MKNYEIHVDEDLRETKAHGSVEYPLSVYHLEFTNVYLGHIRWHWHDEIEFNLVIEGSAQFLIGDRTIQVNKGEAIFINQNILHSVHPMNGIQCKIQVLVFHPAIIFGNGQPYLNANYVLPVLTCNDYIYDVINTTSTLGSDILHCIHQIIYCNEEHLDFFELVSKGLLCELWSYMLKRLPYLSTKKLYKASQQDELRVKHAMLYIQQHFSEPISLDHISDSISISKSECCRCFKRILGLSPFQYIMRYRIFEAVRLIQQNKSSQCSISDIAYSVGFNNISYFNKLFKEYMLCTPSTYMTFIEKSPTTSYIQRKKDLLP